MAKRLKALLNRIQRQFCLLCMHRKLVSIGLEAVQSRGVVLTAIKETLLGAEEVISSIAMHYGRRAG